MNKTVILGATIPMFLLLLPNQVFALSNRERYNIGWQSGVSGAQYDWNNGVQYDPLCPAHHPDYFSRGYQVGYNHWWESVHHSNQQITQGSEQQAKVNILGNDNRVNINQKSNDQVENAGDYSRNGNEQLPKCVILCSTINVH